MGKLYRPARARAFQALFEAEFTDAAPLATLQREQARLPLPAAEVEYAQRLLDGVAAHRAELDRIIAVTAPAWPPDQLPAVDRSILWIALYEVLFNNAAVPIGAAINEAVELAKTYGGDGTRRFVNGVLGTVSRQRGLAPMRRSTETEETA